jgi:hypothetical protein
VAAWDRGDVETATRRLTLPEEGDLPIGLGVRRVPELPAQEPPQVGLAVGGADPLDGDLPDLLDAYPLHALGECAERGSADLGRRLDEQGNPGRGLGEPYLDLNLLVEPTPKIGGASLGALAESVEGVGVQEVGQITVERISTAYSEANLRGLLRGELRHPADAEAYWEITFFGEGQPARRRFNVATVPGRHTFGWTVVLERADGADRDPRTKDLALSKPAQDPL